MREKGAFGGTTLHSRRVLYLFKRKGFTFDAAVHHIGGCGKWSVVGRCFKTLGIEMDFYPLDPMDHLIFPNFSIEIPADFGRVSHAFTGSLSIEKR